MAKKKEIEVPKDLEAFRKWVYLYGCRKREIAGLKQRHADAVAQLKKGHGDQLKPAESDCDRLEKGIAAFATAHRKELCQDDEKFIDIPEARISWRWGPWSVKIPQRILDLFKEGKLKQILELFPRRFVRRKFEPNRDLMGEVAQHEAALAAGATLEQSEFLYLEFNDEELSSLGEVEGPKTGTKKK